jgi:hypothetical protein
MSCDHVKVKLKVVTFVVTFVVTVFERLRLIREEWEMTRIDTTSTCEIWKKRVSSFFC